MASGQPPFRSSAPGGLPTNGNVLGPQQDGFGLTTAARPGQPDFTPYFGKPLREIKTNAYDAYGRENYALPEAYNGANPFITQIMIQLITEDDMWVTRVALPFRFTEGEMEVAWSVWIFNNHGMDNVPEEGVSRLLSSEMQERRGSYVRYGLGFILEHGFMKTPKGRKCYEMNLVQIRNAILETLYYGAIEEYLLCQEFNQTWKRRHGAQTTLVHARDIMREEIENWACIQKSEGGWDLLDSRCKRVLQDQGHQPNMWILPRGMKPYIALDKNMTAYHLNGTSGQALLDSAKNGQNVSAIDTANNCQIFESKAFQMPEMDEPLDLLWRERACGEYYLMVNHLDGFPHDEYRSSWRDIAIYNEARDQFNPITLRNALEHCARFDPDGYLNEQYAPTPNDTDLLYYADGEGKSPCRFFGDMEEDFLSKDTIRNVSTTLMKPIEMNTEDFVRRFQKGMELIRDLENGTVTMEYLQAIKTKVSGNRMEALTGMPELPTVTASLTDYTPVGYASWPGLQTLAMDKHAKATDYGATVARFHEIAKDFCNLISTMYYRLNRSLFNSVFLDPGQQSPYFTIPDGRTTFFENLISVPRPCMYVADARAPVNAATVDEKERAALNVINNTMGTVEEMKGRTGEALKRMKISFGAFDASKNELEMVANKIIETFSKIMTSSSETDKAKNIAMASKFIGTVCKFTDANQLKAFVRLMSQIDFTSPIEKPMSDAVAEAEKTEAYSPVVMAGGVTRFVRTQLVASKRMLVQIGADGDLSAIMRPSAFLNGMVPPEADFDAMGGPPEGGVADILGKAQMLIRARAGEPNEEFGLEHTTPMTRDVMPVGEKRGRDEYTMESPSKMRFGARAPMVRSSYEEAAFDSGMTGIDGMGRNPGVFGQGIRLFSENVRQRFNEYNLMGDDLRRIGCQAFLGTPVHKKSLERMIDNDVAFPVGFMVARPFITHLMGTAILTTAGSDVGETLVGHADFQLSDNVVQKMHYGNFTFYAKSIIYHPEKVFVVTDIISKRYVMGNDMTYFDEQSFSDFKEGSSGANRSIFVMMIPADKRRKPDGVSSEYDNPIDLTGRLNSSFRVMVHGDEVQYSSAWWYSRHYGFDNQHAERGDYFGYFPRAQTMCFQGMQWNWNPSANSLSTPVQNTGHWGYRVYEGCAPVRSGAMKLLRECNYSMYGGGGAVPSVPLGY